MKKLTKALIVTLLLLLIIVIAGSVYYFQQKTPATTPTQTDSLRTYTNTELGFQFKYSPQASIEEIKNPIGISVAEGWTDKFFQILVNYSKDEISKIKNSPQFLNEQEITIGGLKATKYIIGNSYNKCLVSYILIDRGLGKNFFFNNLVECPTHPEGVDARMLQMVNSFKIL